MKIFWKKTGDVYTLLTTPAAKLLTLETRPMYVISCLGVEKFADSRLSIEEAKKVAIRHLLGILEEITRLCNAE